MSTPDLTIVGNGPPVILVHGVGLDRTMWEGVTRCLSDRCTCITLDLPCHGTNPMPQGPVGLETFADTLAEVVESVAPERPAVIGFSMGAMVAQRYVLDHPGRVDRLVLMNAVFLRDAAQRDAIRDRLALAERDGPSTMTEAALSRWFTPRFQQDQPAAVDRVRQRLLANDPAAYLAAYRVFATADATLAPQAGRIDCPTLALTGALDANSTPAMARALASAIPGASAVVLDGLAHGMPIEAPERVAATLGL